MHFQIGPGDYLTAYGKQRLRMRHGILSFVQGAEMEIDIRQIERVLNHHIPVADLLGDPSRRKIMVDRVLILEAPDLNSRKSAERAIYRAAPVLRGRHGNTKLGERARLRIFLARQVKTQLLK